MTTGSVTIGNDSAAFYSFKSWSGGNDPLRKRENAYDCTIVRKYRTMSTRYINGVYYDSLLFFNTTNWYPTTNTNWGSNDGLAALGKLAEKLRDGAPNLGASLAESKQTAESVVGLCGAAFTGWKQFRKGNFGQALKAWSRFSSRKSVSKKLVVGDVSDAHLALTYGWVPLAQDIYDTMKYFEAKTSAARILTYRANHRKVVDIADCNSGGKPPIPGRGYIQLNQRYHMTERLSAVRSLGLLNPLAVAWEVVPFSFVVDWFIPIGNYFDLLGLFPALDGVYAYTWFMKGESNFTNGFQQVNSATSVYGGGVKHTSIRVIRAQTTLSYGTIPKPSFKSVSDALNLPHLRNAAALIVSGMKSLR